MGSLQRAPLGFGDQLKLPLTELQSSIGMPAVERNQKELRRAYQGLSGSGSDNSEAQACAAEPARNAGAGSTVAEDRSQKLKTKNKVAQKRYRQRNKEKFESLQQEVEALTSSLQHLEMEKQKLETETSMLRAQQQKAGTSGSTQPSLLLGLKKAEEEFVPSRSWAGFNPAGKGGVVLRALFNPPRKLTHEQCLRMSIMDHCRLYREIVFRCGQLLLENSQEDLTSPAGRKLKELMCERRGMAAYISCAAPLSHHFLHSVNLEDPRTELPKADTAFYRTVMRKIGLSDSQKRVLSSAYKQYLGKMRGLLREREELQASIKETKVLTMENTNGGSPCLIISPIYKRMVRLLRENIDAEHIANSVFWGTIFLVPQGLTYFQEAKYLLASWPRFPDPFTMFNLVTHEMGDSCAVDAQPAVKLEEAFLYSPFFYKPMHEKIMTTFLDHNIFNYQDGAEITQAFAEALGVA